MNTIRFPKNTPEQIKQSLQTTGLGPTQVEVLKKALESGAPHDSQALLNIVSRQEQLESDFTHAVIDWLLTNQTIAERIQSALRAAAANMEERLRRGLPID